MPLLNYSTKVPVSRTVSHIQNILAINGASRIMVEYEEAKPIGITFEVVRNDSIFNYKLPANVDGVEAVLQTERIQKAFKTRNHSERVAWRILKDWVEAQLAIIYVNMATMEQVFLPYLLLSNDYTVYDKFLTHGKKLLN